MSPAARPCLKFFKRAGDITQCEGGNPQYKKKRKRRRREKRREEDRRMKRGPKCLQFLLGDLFCGSSSVEGTDRLPWRPGVDSSLVTHTIRAGSQSRVG